MNPQRTLLITFLCILFCIPCFYCISKESRQNLFGNDILLIINYHFPFYQSMDLLKKIYSPYFPHIVFYGPKSHPNVNVVDHYHGWYSYKDIAMAMQKYPDYTGYLLINDDLIINPQNFERFDKNCVWIYPFLQPDLAPNAFTSWTWWQRKEGYTAIKKVYEQLNEASSLMIKQNLGDNKVARGFSDIAYIPARCSQQFIKVCSLCVQHNVFLEIALPTICASIIPIEQIQHVKGTALWDAQDRARACEYLNHSIDFVHPIKLSSQENREFIEQYFNSTKEQP
jgi:hypothetical protein